MTDTITKVEEKEEELSPEVKEIIATVLPIVKYNTKKFFEKMKPSEDDVPELTEKQAKVVSYIHRRDICTDYRRLICMLMDIPEKYVHKSTYETFETKGFSIVVPIADDLGHKYPLDQPFLIKYDGARSDIIHNKDQPIFGSSTVDCTWNKKTFAGNYREPTEEEISQFLYNIDWNARKDWFRDQLHLF